jgi:hypothetical protein
LLCNSASTSQSRATDARCLTSSRRPSSLSTSPHIRLHNSEFRAGAGIDTARLTSIARDTRPPRWRKYVARLPRFAAQATCTPASSTDTCNRKPPKPSQPPTPPASTKRSISPSSSTAFTGSCAPSSSPAPSRDALSSSTSSFPRHNSSSSSPLSVNLDPRSLPRAPSNAPAKISMPRV